MRSRADLYVNTRVPKPVSGLLGRAVKPRYKTGAPDAVAAMMWAGEGQAIYRTIAQKDSAEERVVIDNGLCLFS